MDIHSYLVITFHIHAYMYVHYTSHTHTKRESVFFVGPGLLQTEARIILPLLRKR